jgi:hypothetical protein
MAIADKFKNMVQIFGIALEDSTSGESTTLKSVNGAALVSASSLNALSGGQSSAVAISGTTAASAAITAGSVVATPTVDCFFRVGAATPTAVSNGTDQILLGGNTYRISGITSGHMLAFITTGAAGTVYVSPGG